jgi:rhamnosyltransferase
MNLSVASVTTAYNAASVLPRQMDALLRQTRPLQEIVVVDNGSTDGTNRLLAERYPQVKVLRIDENCGVGNGWAAGLAYAALEKQHDWVWTFDDDSVPNDDALEILLNGVAFLRNVDGALGMVAPLPVHRETGICYPPLLWRDGFVRPSAELVRQPIWFADLAVGAGCMIRREVVETIGLPRADFLMDFIDFEYWLRARSRGYKLAVISRSQMSHEVGNARKVRFLGRSRLWADQAPWRNYYIGRNLAYIGWWLYPSRRTKRFVIRHLARHSGGVLLFGSNKVACLRKLAQGFCDGRRATLGARFHPE